MDPVFQNHRAQYVLGMILIARHDVGQKAPTRCAGYLAGYSQIREMWRASESVLSGFQKGAGN